MPAAFDKCVEFVFMSPTDLRKELDTLDGLNDENLCEAAVAPVWPGRGVEDELSHVALASLGQRALFTTTLLAREVDNGGLFQFFHNSSCMYWRHVLSGLELLGAKEHEQAFATALEVFPGGEPPLDEEERRDMLFNLNENDAEKLESGDRRLYAGAGVESTLLPFWVAYIKSHPEEFFILKN
jgi:hypothetical protein